MTLEKLMARGAAFLGTKYAIMGGAMTWVSDRYLVSAISNADGFGVIACGAMTPERLYEEIIATKELTQKPFGVNLITIHPDLSELVDVCTQAHVSHVVLAGGIPPASAIERVKKSGAELICFTPTVGLGKRLIKMGATALIVEGNEAGGHVGPVSTSILSQEILPHIKEVPIFIAGGIGSGQSMVSYMQMGAAGCQLGSRFVCSSECRAHPNFKNAFIRANSRDAVSSVQLDPRLPVIPVRALLNAGTRRFIDKQKELIAQLDAQSIDPKEAQLEIERYWAGALRRAVVDGDVDNGSVMAGQSVGMITAEQSTQEIIDELIEQGKDFLKQNESCIL